MSEFVGNSLILVGVVLFVGGLIAVFRPWNRWLTTRKMAAGAMVLSVFACGTGTALAPPPESTKAASIEDEAAETGDAEMLADADAKMADESDEGEEETEVFSDSQRTAFKRLWEEVLAQAKPCDEANDRVIEALGTGSVYNAYKAADAGHSICRTTSMQIGRLDPPGGLPDERENAIEESLETCANAYLFRQISMDKMRDLLDDGMKPSRMRAFEESAQAAQGGVLACVAGMMSEGVALGIELEEFGAN